MINILENKYVRFLTCFGILSFFILSSCSSFKSNQYIIINMPYHEARNIILQNGWNPVPGNMSDENIGIPAIMFRNLGYIEVVDCTSAGVSYCAFYFQNKNGEYLKIETKGEDDGLNSRLQARVVHASIRSDIQNIIE